MSYGVERGCRVDGHQFQSTLEAARWIELRHLERHGEIGDLQRSVRFRLPDEEHGVESVLTADFLYVQSGDLVMEEMKREGANEFWWTAEVMADRLDIEARQVGREDVATWAQEKARKARASGQELRTSWTMRVARLTPKRGLNGLD